MVEKGRLTVFVFFFLLQYSLLPQLVSSSGTTSYDEINDDVYDSQAINRSVHDKRRRSSSRRKLAESLQPKLTRVEQGAASKVIGSISMAEGSPWCSPKGAPMFWLGE